MRLPALPFALPVALLACSHGTYDTDSAAVEPYLLDLDTAVDAMFDQKNLESALAAAVSAARVINGLPAITAYTTALESQTADCPSRYTDANGLEYWYDTCTTEAGASFSGLGYAMDYDAYSDGTYIWTGPAFYAAATIDTAQGETFTGSGSAYALVGDASTADTVVTIWYSVLAGSFAWNGPDASGTWLTGDTPTLSSWLTDYGGLHAGYFEGSVPIDAETGYDLAVFDAASLSDAAAGWACPGELDGGVSVHSVEGVWYDVMYTGTDPNGGCDQCGDVWQDGVGLGQACLDASAWL
ncbi:MAG: hypothetical protein EXR69_12990, partial [Myxococcales bacterium]|nr:hypothetical protein [Myxococcales bacterium]